jgi:hypothetical protein
MADHGDCLKLNLALAGVVAFLVCSTLYAQSGKLSDQEFRKVAQSHSNAEEHQKLAAHYTAHAIEHEGDAKTHEELANQSDKTEPTLSGEARHYAAHSHEAAEALRAMARLHLNLAKEHTAKK